MPSFLIFTYSLFTYAFNAGTFVFLIIVIAGYVLLIIGSVLDKRILKIIGRFITWIVTFIQLIINAASLYGGFP